MFSRSTLDFLDELARNNNRAWFEEHKPRYETCVREPALDFITAMAPALAAFAPHFRADASRMGGSLMRIHRDVRFARDKSPYKTNVGIQFRHEQARDVHAPGFYVHVAPDECFLAVGCWRPEAAPLSRLRDFVAEHPERWFAARDDSTFARAWQLSGDSLARPPRGYAADLPAIDDIKRKDFVAVLQLAPGEVLGRGFVKLAARQFAKTAPFMGVLCRALDLPL